MVQSFEDYRDRMLAIMATAEAHLLAEPPADTDVLDLARVRMARVVTAYHLYADRELFTPCLSIGDARHRARVKEVAADCAAIAQDFRAFTRACMDRRPLDHWAEYRQTALANMARIRKHLRDAEVEVRRCDAMAPAGQQRSAA